MVTTPLFSPGTYGMVAFVGRPQKRICTFRAETRIGQLRDHDALIDSLTGAELIVLLRLVAETGRQKSGKVTVFNVQLHKNPRTAMIALRELEDMGLVKVTYKGGREGRTIEVIQ